MEPRRALATICALATTAAVSCGERVVSNAAGNDAGTSPVTAFEAVVTTVPSDMTTTDPPTTSPPLTYVIDVTTTTASLAGSVDDTLPPPVPATEQQLALLAAAFSMPGRPDLHDVPYGQEVTVGNRTLVVNVPIFGAWQYNDLDAQGVAGASTEASEAATRDLLSKLGIDATGLTATFTPNGPRTDVDLAGCIVSIAADGRIVFAYGLLEDIT